MSWIQLLVARITLAAATFLVVGAGLAPSALAATSEIKLEPASIVVEPGKPASIDVIVNTDVPIRGVQLKLQYDPKLIQIDRVTEGSFFQSWADAHGARALMVFPFTPDNTLGETTVGGIALFGGPSTGGASGSGTLITVHLTGLAGATGSSTLAMGKVILADPAAQRLGGVQASDAAIVVGPGSVAAAPAPTPYVAVVATQQVIVESPVDSALLWMRVNQVRIELIGGGLVAAAVLYALVMWLGARERRGRA